MAGFLNVVSGFLLVVVWLFAGVMMLSAPPGSDPLLMRIMAFGAAIGLSIPAVALFAFGQVVEDVRTMRDHLGAMRKYYEPSHKYEGM